MHTAAAAQPGSTRLPPLALPPLLPARLRSLIQQLLR